MEYTKYRWFFTKSDKLVYGGKSAEQNEKIVNELLKSGENKIIMHTRLPGSPFAVIDSPIKKVNESDLAETAVWCASFSRAWRSGLKRTVIDIFNSNQISKKREMKSGTFGVLGRGEKKIVELKLYLVKQKGVLRAVPLQTLKTKDKVLGIVPGRIEKDKFASIIAEKLNVSKEEALNCLPTGGFKLCK